VANSLKTNLISDIIEKYEKILMILLNLIAIIVFLLCAIYGIPILPFLGTALYDFYISIAAAFSLWALAIAYTTYLGFITDKGVSGTQLHTYARHITKASYWKPIANGHILLALLVLANLALPTILVSTYKIGSNMIGIESKAVIQELRLRDIGGCNDTLCVITSDSIISNASREIITTSKSRYAYNDNGQFVMPKTPSWAMFNGDEGNFANLRASQVLSAVFNVSCNTTPGPLTNDLVKNKTFWYTDNKLTDLSVSVSQAGSTLQHTIQANIHTDTQDMSFSCIIDLYFAEAEVEWSFTTSGFEVTRAKLKSVVEGTWDDEITAPVEGLTVAVRNTLSRIWRPYYLNNLAHPEKTALGFAQSYAEMIIMRGSKDGSFIDSETTYVKAHVSYITTVLNMHRAYKIVVGSILVLSLVTATVMSAWIPWYDRTLSQYICMTKQSTLYEMRCSPAWQAVKLCTDYSVRGLWTIADYIAPGSSNQLGNMRHASFTEKECGINSIVYKGEEYYGLLNMSQRQVDNAGSILANMCDKAGVLRTMMNKQFVRLAKYEGYSHLARKIQAKERDKQRGLTMRSRRFEMIRYRNRLLSYRSSILRLFTTYGMDSASARITLMMINHDVTKPQCATAYETMKSFIRQCGGDREDDTDRHIFVNSNPISIRKSAPLCIMQIPNTADYYLTLLVMQIISRGRKVKEKDLKLHIQMTEGDNKTSPPTHRTNAVGTTYHMSQCESGTMTMFRVVLVETTGYLNTMGSDGILQSLIISTRMYTAKAKQKGLHEPEVSVSLVNSCV